MIRNCFKLHKFLRDCGQYFFLFVCTRDHVHYLIEFLALLHKRSSTISLPICFSNNWRSDRLHVFLFRILVNKFSNRLCIYELLHERIKEKFQHFIRSYFSYIFYQSFITSIFEIILNRYFHISLLQLFSIYLVITFNLC